MEIIEIGIFGMLGVVYMALTYRFVSSIWGEEKS